MRPRIIHLLAVSLLAAAGAAACDKSEPTPDTKPAVSTSKSTTTPSASSTTATTAATSATPSATASAATIETAPDAASPSATASTSASAAPSSSTASATADAGAVTCGPKGMPACPLQGWMKGNIAGPSVNQDFPKLAIALDTIIGFAPPGYGNWGSIAKDGAAAARKQDIDGVKASCAGCHKQYQDRYKREMRTRKI